MFTGIIEAVGEVTHIESKAKDSRLSITATDFNLNEVKIGDSIAINGVCLTVINKSTNSFKADVSAETLNKTSLASLEIGSKINLEKAMKANGRFDGHIVSGHVDDIGLIVSKTTLGESIQFGIRVPANLSKYIAVKGSICIDGTSLTVNEINDCDFYVNIIPHTIKSTIIDNYQVGSKVNLEIDIIARYLERLILDNKPEQKITEQLLRDNGYL